MEMTDYINEIKLELTGNLLSLEITDDTLELVVKKAFREVQRFIDTTKLMTVPFSSCIDLSNSKVSSVTRIFRSAGYLGSAEQDSTSMQVDPMYAMQWQFLTGSGDIYNLNDWIMNYASWNTVLQMRNTTSTDLAFKQDKQAEKLYINTMDKPTSITIEFVPKFENVNEITSDYWIDILVRMSIALTKITLGRIRSRYIQTNALWAQDGDTLLQEGNKEIETLRETLRVNAQLMFPID
jgi:hypothetical protein